MVKTCAKISKVYVSEKTTICSCENFADFPPFQPRVSLPLNFLNYFSCVVVVGFPWYIYISKWLGWGKLHNDIDLPLFTILFKLLVINHSLSKRRTIFVSWWLKLSLVLVVLQLAWVHFSLQLSWIMQSGVALCLALDRVIGPWKALVSGYLWHRSKWFPSVRPCPLIYIRAWSVSM